MKNLFKQTLVASLLFSAVLLPPSLSRLAAADDPPTFRQADHNLTEAMAKGDKNAVAALLDERFQWVEANGRMHSKAQVLDDLAQFASDNEGAIDVRTMDFLGRVERVLGMHHNQRFAHLWVKNPAGWQAFVYLNIPIPAERPDYMAPPSPPTEADKVCDNPCKTLPYKPENAVEQGALDTWYRLKNDEWRPNADDWAAHADDNHETLTPRADIPKLQHVQELAEERKAVRRRGRFGWLLGLIHAHVRFWKRRDHAERFRGAILRRKPTSWNLRFVSEPRRRLENRTERSRPTFRKFGVNRPRKKIVYFCHSVHGERNDKTFF